MINTSLIISTYNWAEALQLCLKSLLQQKCYPLEIIIADDGSDERTKAVVDAFKIISPVAVKHIWQADEGFRLAAIRNKAIAAAAGDYIIQIDGDELMHPFFVKDHVAFAKRKTFVRASRIYLNATLSQKMLSGHKLKVDLFSKGLSNKTSAIRLPFLWPFFETTYKNKGDERFEIHGSNMAYYKEDALLVNGYNEMFVGWGPEDKEFVARLLNAGVKKRFIKLGGLVYHLHHKNKSKSRLAFNESLLKEAICSNIKFCAKGLNQYL